MKVTKKTVKAVPYQRVSLPNGAAPVAVGRGHDGGNHPDPTLIDIFYIDPYAEQTDENSTLFGLFVTWSDQELPGDVVLFPVKHPLINQIEQPNARYVGTVGNQHVFLGNPRPQKD